MFVACIHPFTLCLNVFSTFLQYSQSASTCTIDRLNGRREKDLESVKEREWWCTLSIWKSICNVNVFKINWLATKSWQVLMASIEGGGSECGKKFVIVKTFYLFSVINKNRCSTQHSDLSSCQWIFACRCCCCCCWSFFLPKYTLFIRINCKSTQSPKKEMTNRR